MKTKWLVGGIVVAGAGVASYLMYKGLAPAPAAAPPTSANDGSATSSSDFSYAVQAAMFLASKAVFL